MVGTFKDKKSLRSIKLDETLITSRLKIVQRVWENSLMKIERVGMELTESLPLAWDIRLSFTVKREGYKHFARLYSPSRQIM